MSLIERFEKQLAARGLTVVLAGDHAPDTLMLSGLGEKTPEILEAAKKFKPALLAKLRPPATVQPVEPPPSPSENPAGE